MNRKEHFILVLVLGSLTAVGPFSIDMYLPGFPAIAKDLGTDIAHVSLTLTSYFIGISLGQLGFGPLLDKYGRKKPVVAGLTLYIAAAVGCGLAPNIEWLIALRCVLAFGSCVGIVASRAIVRDLFPIQEIPRMFSTLMLVLGVSPIIAPSVGAYVTEAFGWRAIFVILALIAAVILAVVAKYLPESYAGNRAVSLHPVTMARNYLQLFRERKFVAYGLASAAASVGLFSYISDAPFVFMNLYGLTEREFGLAFGLSACGVIGSSQLNRLWLRFRTSMQISLTAVSLQAGIALMFVAAAFSGLPVAVVFTLVCCYLATLGALSPNTTAVAIEPFERQAGTASALLGSMQMIGGAAGSALVSAFHNGTALPMAGILVAAALVSLGFQLWYRGRNLSSVTMSA